MTVSPQNQPFSGCIDGRHDGRLLTLEDTVEFFNLVLGTKLNQQEKRDLAAFMRVL